MINARSETAAEKPLFRKPLLASRCVVPTTGFYEWNTAKEKFLFQYADSTVVYLAGLWEIFEGQRRYTILTTSPNQAVRAVHNRMPVLLSHDCVRAWLTDADAAIEMLRAEPPELVGKPMV